MDVVCVDATVSAQQAAKPSGIESGPGAKHTPRRDTALLREACGQVGHHVHGIGGNNKDRFRCVFQNRGYDFAKHLSVALEQLQPSLAWLLSDARTEDHDATTRQILVSTRPNS